MHLVVTSVRNAVSDESLNGFKVLDFRSRSSRLKSGEFQRCSEVEMFFPVESGKRAKKEICWGPRSFGWMERQGRKAWHKI